MIMKKKLLLLITIFFTCQISNSQTNSIPEFPVVGRAMPYFELGEIQNFNKTKANLNDFRGKWLVLDWWTRFCATCVESFPKVNALQKEFGDKVQFLYISYTGNNGNSAIREIYSQAKQKLNLMVPFAFDSTLYQKYNLWTTPYVVVIDPKGIVRGITIGLNSQNVRDFIAGKQPVLWRAYRRDESETAYNERLPFLTYDNGGSDTDFVFRSLISKWAVGKPIATVWSSDQSKVEILGHSLESLIFWAFEHNFLWGWQDARYGKFYPRAVLELKDSSFFKQNYETGEGVYNYSLIIKKDSINKEYVKHLMQKDIESYFDISISVEFRKMPYWKLVAISDEAKSKLKTKHSTVEFKDNRAAGFTNNNFSVKSAIISHLWGYFPDGPPFIDETGIEGNIDITINALLTDFNDFKRALNENGLDLVIGEKEMKVLVVRDNEVKAVQ
jgi:thiol-disulfide isomerase/thioredoxin